MNVNPVNYGSIPATSAKKPDSAASTNNQGDSVEISETAKTFQLLFQQQYKDFSLSEKDRAEWQKKIEEQCLSLKAKGES